MSLPKPYALCITLASAVAVLAANDACLAEELVEGKHEVTSKLNGEVVAVVVQIADGRDCLDPLSVKWGVDEACPRHRIASLAVRHGGTDGFVAASAYSDITALRRVEIEPTEGGFEVTLRGGDAATGYRALLGFSVQNARKVPILVSRKVWSSTNPDEPVDVFQYRYPPIDGNY